MIFSLVITAAGIEQIRNADVAIRASFISPSAGIVTIFSIRHFVYSVRPEERSVSKGLLSSSIRPEERSVSKGCWGWHFFQYNNNHQSYIKG
jgi:hypothetical protein